MNVVVVAAGNECTTAAMTLEALRNLYRPENRVCLMTGFLWTVPPAPSPPSLLPPLLQGPTHGRLYSPPPPISHGLDENTAAGDGVGWLERGMKLGMEQGVVCVMLW
ncbi:hypothetical protein E2C01_089313 [Portunus trituberculatus]|uniref:Uncharacterized protein n=1 Tax=Portunus trituberculatus TaxID=210409 RepID=A0A5B7JLW5_PORTR|nr:hypothetical protein [Portunus trituberculatus]